MAMGALVKEESSSPPRVFFPGAETSRATSTSSLAGSTSSTTSAATPAPTSGSATSTPGSQVQRRGRRSKPKVKTGCINCKQRRIKCDEKRPACTQCVRSHKTCTGYPPPSRSARPYEEIRIAPKPLPVLQARPNLASAPVVAGPAPPPNLVVHPETVSPFSGRQRLTSAGPSEHQGLAAASTPPTLYQPSHSLPFSQTEGLYFQIFRTHTASELSGYFDSVFWTSRVLQECHGEIAIRHAVVALGALYKTLEQSCEPWASPPPGAVSLEDSILSHWQVAVKQYSEACNAMVLLNGQSHNSHRIRLMSSVLLACFDSFIGDHRQAIIQIQTGLGLLEQLQSERRLLGPSAVDTIEEELVVVFTRLAIQAKSYDLAFHFPEPYVIRLAPHLQNRTSPASDSSSSSSTSTALSGPFYFTSVHEARLAADKLGEKMLLFLERLYAAKEEPSNVLPSSWKQYGLAFGSKLEAWHESFEPVFQSRMAPDIKYLDKAAIAALKMSQTNSQILFLMMFCHTEDQFDSFYPHFKTIVDLGLEVVSDQERKAAAERCPNPEFCHHRKPHPLDPPASPEYTAHHIKPSFSADLGIVPPLFVVATKCRDPIVRRQAIQLLRSSSRREGMWDSELAAHIGQWIMQLEEHDSGDFHDNYGSSNVFDGAVQQPQQYGPGGNSAYTGRTASMSPTAKMIPEHCRVMVKSVDFDLRARVADLRVGTRGIRHDLPDKRFRETHISW